MLLQEYYSITSLHLRGNEFVTKKIVSQLVKLNKKISKMYLGNIYAKRDWGYSLDYVEAMWKMLQQKKPDDFVISSGINIQLNHFINKAAKNLKLILNGKVKELNEKAYDKKTNKLIIRIDKKFFRPTEVNYLYGDSKKQKKI